jgi:hypothetical protein
MHPNHPATSHSNRFKFDYTGNYVSVVPGEPDFWHHIKASEGLVPLQALIESIQRTGNVDGITLYGCPVKNNLLVWTLRQSGVKSRVIPV